MIAIKDDNIDELKGKLENGITIMYGAGGNGERIWRLFHEHSIKVDYFCDDDYNKWNTFVCGAEVISFDRLQSISKSEKINVVLTSVFSGPILEKLEHLNVIVYEAFCMLMDNYYRNSFYKIPLDESRIRVFEKKINLIIDNMGDRDSKDILRKILGVIKEPDEMPYSHFFNVASGEDCYFIQPVLEAMPEKPVIIDGGGFTGDLMVALKRHMITYDKVFSFEVNKELFTVMQENIEKNGLKDNFIAINKAIWDTSEPMYLHIPTGDIAGGMVGEEQTGIRIDTVTIDEFFEQIEYDFIKMDIEGAELRALRGGIKTIKKCRPIMAISLYHSIDDVVDIPLYLIDELESYYYLIRHHSFIDSETVLYCIPCEKRL